MKKSRAVRAAVTAAPFSFAIPHCSLPCPVFLGLLSLFLPPQVVGGPTRQTTQRTQRSQWAKTRQPPVSSRFQISKCRVLDSFSLYVSVSFF